MTHGAGEPGRPDDSLSEQIIGTCIEIHRCLGPGLLDVLVDEQIIVELKAVERLHSLHTAQLLTYLKLTDCRVGLLINFNVPLLKQGVRRLTHQKNSSALPGSPTPREESDTSWRGD